MIFDAFCECDQETVSIMKRILDTDREDKLVFRQVSVFQKISVPLQQGNSKILRKSLSLPDVDLLEDVEIDS